MRLEYPPLKPAPAAAVQVSRDTLLALLTIVVGVGTYYANLFSLSRVGLAAILANMAFAVLERLTQRYLMAQSPVDLSKPAMMLLNNAFGLVPGVALCAAECGRDREGRGARGASVLDRDG